MMELNILVLKYNYNVIILYYFLYEHFVLFCCLGHNKIKIKKLNGWYFPNHNNFIYKKVYLYYVDIIIGVI